MELEREALPEVAARTCIECPWTKQSAAGHLGPYSAERWADIVHSETPIACHVTLRESGSWEGARQCAGAAQHRANTHKRPRDPEVAVAEKRDDRLVFGTTREFIAHHNREAS